MEIEGEDNLHQLRPQNNLHRSRRKYNLHQLRPQDKGRARLPKQMNFRKTSKRGEGGVIFNPKNFKHFPKKMQHNFLKIYVANFVQKTPVKSPI